MCDILLGGIKLHFYSLFPACFRFSRFHFPLWPPACLLSPASPLIIFKHTFPVDCLCLDHHLAFLSLFPCSLSPAFYLHSHLAAHLFRFPSVIYLLAPSSHLLSPSHVTLQPFPPSHFHLYFTSNYLPTHRSLLTLSPSHIFLPLAASHLPPLIFQPPLTPSWHTSPLYYSYLLLFPLSGVPLTLSPHSRLISSSLNSSLPVALCSSLCFYLHPSSTFYLLSLSLY